MVEAQCFGVLDVVAIFVGGQDGFDEEAAAVVGSAMIHIDLSFSDDRGFPVFGWGADDGLAALGAVSWNATRTVFSNSGLRRFFESTVGADS